MNAFKNFMLGFATAIVLICGTIVILDLTGTVDFPELPINGRKRTDIISDNTKTKVNEIGNYVDYYYLNDVDDTMMTDGICAGVMAGLGDKYAAYYNGAQTENYDAMINGTYRGIGVTVKKISTGPAIIVGVNEDSPASRAGVMRGDRILKVDGKGVVKLSLDEVVSLIKTDKDEVTLTLRRRRKIIEITVEIEEIENESVEYMMLTDKVGYIYLSKFDKSTTEQFKDALDSMQADGMESLCLDLRNNGGGLVDIATDIADFFYPKGESICYTKDKNGVEVRYETENNDELDIPVVLIANSQTASAAEILIGAFRDLSGSKLYGSKTYGKGIVQTAFSLSDGTVVKFTTAKYYTPKGDCIHEKGFEPDFQVADADDTTFKELTKNRDALLQDACVSEAVKSLE